MSSEAVPAPGTNTASPGTLASRSAVLEAHVRELQRVRTAAEEAKLFRTRRAELRTAVQRLAEPAGTVSLFKAHQILQPRNGSGAPPPVPERHLQRLGTYLTQLRSLRAKYLADATVMRDLDGRPTLFTDVQNVAGAVDVALMPVWTAYVGAYQQTHGVQLEDSLLDVLGQLGSLAGAVKRVRTLREQVRLKSEKLPRTEADLTGFQEAVAELRLAWEQLSGGGVPEGVVQFIRAAGGAHGAELGLLTEDVRQWLLAQGFTGFFAVRIRTRG